MFRLRLVKKSDRQNILKLASKAPFGMTNIPRSLEEIEKKIDLSLIATEAFINKNKNDACDKDLSLTKDNNNLSSHPTTISSDILQDFTNSISLEHAFFLVLEEEDGTISGLSAIYTNLGSDRPFYTYRISNLDSLSPELNIRIAHKILILVNDYHGFSELGSLLLDPDYRRDGRGKLLSYGRFMLMAQNPQLFGDEVMAEMLGPQDENGNSPFWSAIGSKFINLAFQDADLQTTKDNHFITDLMPKFPIYIALLPSAAQEVIAKTHKHTKPARAMLEKQGLTFKANIDIFDAGPCLESRIKDIPLIKNCGRQKLSSLPSDDERSILVANIGFENFAVTYNINDKNKLAKLLNMPSKDLIAYSNIK